MELDELRKSWNKLNEQLERKSLVNEQAISELIAKYERKADGKINEIAGWGKFSAIIGCGGFLLIIICCFFITPLLDISEEAIGHFHSYGIFFSVILLVGGWWDTRTYLWLKRTRIEELPVVKVIERINKFRQWIKYEIIALIIILILLVGLIYCTNELYQKSAMTQFIFLAFCIVILGIIIHFLYKKLIFDNLQDIRKNLDELRELKND